MLLVLLTVVPLVSMALRGARGTCAVRLVAAVMLVMRVCTIVVVLLLMLLGHRSLLLVLVVVVLCRGLLVGRFLIRCVLCLVVVVVGG